MGVWRERYEDRNDEGVPKSKAEKPRIFWNKYMNEERASMPKVLIKKLYKRYIQAEPVFKTE